MDPVEVARQANVVLGTCLFTYSIYRLTRDWPVWSRRERAVRVHLVGYIFVCTVGTALLLWNVFPDARAFLLLTVQASFALALWRNRRDPVDTRT